MNHEQDNEALSNTKFRIDSPILILIAAIAITFAVTVTGYRLGFLLS